MTSRNLALLAAALAFMPVVATAEPLADDVTAATLAAPLPTPLEIIVDGRIWTCQAQTCSAHRGGPPESQSIGRECARAAMDFGAFTAYQTGAKILSADQLAVCNRHAVKTPVTRQPVD